MIVGDLWSVIGCGIVGPAMLRCVLIRRCCSGAHLQRRWSCRGIRVNGQVAEAEQDVMCKGKARVVGGWKRG